MPGRLGRGSRDPNAGGGDRDTVRWPELLEKFRNTQERARRRNERIMRGEAAVGVGGVDALGGGPATRSLLALDLESAVGGHLGGMGGVGGNGRTSRNSGRGGAGGGYGEQGQQQQQFASAGGAAGARASWSNRPRPGSGLGRPMGPPGLKIPGAGAGGGPPTAGGGGGWHAASASLGSLSGGAGAGGGGASSAGGASGPGAEKGHKPRHSLVGKFASGIARSAGSRERDREKGRDRK